MAAYSCTAELLIQNYEFCISPPFPRWQRRYVTLPILRTESRKQVTPEARSTHDTTYGMYGTYGTKRKAAGFIPSYPQRIRNKPPETLPEPYAE